MEDAGDHAPSGSSDLVAQREASRPTAPTVDDPSRRFRGTNTDICLTYTPGLEDPNGPSHSLSGKNKKELVRWAYRTNYLSHRVRRNSIPPGRMADLERLEGFLMSDLQLYDPAKDASASQHFQQAIQAEFAAQYKQLEKFTQAAAALDGQSRGKKTATEKKKKTVHPAWSKSFQYVLQPDWDGQLVDPRIDPLAIPTYVQKPSHIEVFSLEEWEKIYGAAAAAIVRIRQNNGSELQAQNADTLASVTPSSGIPYRFASTQGEPNTSEVSPQKKTSSELTSHSTRSVTDGNRRLSQPSEDGRSRESEAHETGAHRLTETPDGSLRQAEGVIDNLHQNQQASSGSRKRSIDSATGITMETDQTASKRRRTLDTDVSEQDGEEAGGKKTRQDDLAKDGSDVPDGAQTTSGTHQAP